VANALYQVPIVIDTDMLVSYRNSVGITATNPPWSQVTSYSVIVPAGNMLSAGTILFTDALAAINLLKIPVNGSTTFPINVTLQTPLQWRDFIATGLTATGCVIQLWVR